ncbi:hypothetical protein EJ994_03400 [Maribacter sp. MJ134]|uniref:hypothetical protein n=1 Tax=Maribacter sp. MJ134 TaxID=2496865 RepID=UPI000F81FF3D|nr:hypothetical protein [Maribacter sp. MJ134]AZQ57896.1 hypothetical protein EJ994_03400 [Maribacter sp. MJ134]
MIKNILSQVGSIASLFGLIFTLKSDQQTFGGLEWFLLFASFFLCFVSIYLLVIEYTSNKPQVYKNKSDIRDYMFDWIKNGGRVVIFTRDMSWVNDDEMKNLLRNKSRNRECIICMPKKIDKAVELENEGAIIIEYPSLDYTPLSRFTIINYGRDDAKIAVGKSIDSGKHLIEEFGNGEHPFFQVANDLVRILEKSAK